MSAPASCPHRSGSQRPATPAPAHACDAHIHVHDPRFVNATAPGKLLATRTVIVQPRVHGTDNRATLAAIAALGREHARGVAVVHPDVSDAELARLHAGGIRGIRFSLYTTADAATDFAMVEPLARRIHALGWHLQLHWTAQQIVQHEVLLKRLPGTLVFDHLARLPLPQGHSHPACLIVRRLLDAGRTWIKLSGPYLDSHVGAPGGYADLDAIACGWVADAPERLVWGSDWPHVTESNKPENNKPDDAALFDLLARWVPDADMRHQILVENPAALYDFAPTPTTETAP